MGKQKTYPHELIGEKVRIISSTNPTHEGFIGKIIDETKATLTLDQGGKVKKFLKNNITFQLLEKEIIIDGKTICKRPEDRIKG